jgi:hypothetical protein
MLKRVSITLEEQELVELEAILLDKDEQEALRYLRDVINKKVKAAQKEGC